MPHLQIACYLLNKHMQTAANALKQKWDDEIKKWHDNNNNKYIVRGWHVWVYAWTIRNLLWFESALADCIRWQQWAVNKSKCNKYVVRIFGARKIQAADSNQNVFLFFFLNCNKMQSVNHYSANLLKEWIRIRIYFNDDSMPE